MAAAGDMSVLSPTVDAVQLESLALMKVVQHCHETMPKQVSGRLFGLLVGGVLEITNTFPVPSDSTKDGREDPAERALQHACADVSIDANEVGWYQSAPFSEFCSPDFVSTQLEWQKSTPGSVSLLYDPTTARSGSLGIRAVRLTDEFVARHTDGASAGAAAAGKPLLASGIFTELPVRIHQNPVMEALVVDLAAACKGDDSGATASAAAGGDVDCDRERLELNAQDYLDRHLSLLSDQLDSLPEQVVSAQVWERRAAIRAGRVAAAEAAHAEENARRRAARAEELPLDRSSDVFRPLPDTATRERELAVLSAAQAAASAREMSRMTSRSFGKAFLAGALQANA